MIAFCLHVVIGKHKSVKVCNWSITEKHVKIPEIVFPLRAVAGTVFAELSDLHFQYVLSMSSAGQTITTFSKLEL